MAEQLREEAYAYPSGKRLAYSGGLDRKQKVCFNCGIRGTVGKLFGVRLSGNYYITQPWCKQCRKMSGSSSRTESSTTKSHVTASTAGLTAKQKQRLRLQNLRKKTSATSTAIAVLLLTFLAFTPVSAAEIDDMNATVTQEAPVLETVTVPAGFKVLIVPKDERNRIEKISDKLKATADAHPKTCWVIKWMGKVALWGCQVVAAFR